MMEFLYIALGFVCGVLWVIEVSAHGFMKGTGVTVLMILTAVAVGLIRALLGVGALIIALIVFAVIGVLVWRFWK